MRTACPPYRSGRHARMLAGLSLSNVNQADAASAGTCRLPPSSTPTCPPTSAPGTKLTSAGRTRMSAFEGTSVINRRRADSVNNAVDGAHTEALEYSAAECGSGNDRVCCKGDTWWTLKRSAAGLPQ
jgi:hypothetical protein